MTQSLRAEISIKANVAPRVSRSLLKHDFAIDSVLNPRPIGPIQNDLLAALPAKELAFLLPHLEFVDLSFDQKLHDYGDKLSYVYFPTTAIVALLYVLADGGVTEIAVIGHEGMVGISAVMGERAIGTAMVQSQGYAYRLKTSVLKEACNQGGQLQSLMMCYTQALFAQMAQNSVSGRHYSVDQQLSRWLLDRLDRLPTNELKVTHELISNMLGVRRESITEAAGKLQHAGLLKYRRGSITVLDREGLEAYAGECYKVAKQAFDVMLANAAIKR